VRRTIILAALIVVAALGAFAWWQHSARQEAERQLGLDAARIVSARFEDRGDLRVASLRGTIVARGDDKGFMGIVPTQQTTQTPYSVDYFLDLRRITPGSYDWNGEARTLTIEVPDVTVAKPNIDETAAQSRQKGLFISRRAALELARQTSQRAAAKSVEQAQKPEYMAKARENAREEVIQMAQGPLQAAGMDDVRVAVRFPWEPKAGSGSSERWDQSRRVEEVLEERRKQGS
jgi:hypothetical protein